MATYSELLRDPRWQRKRLEVLSRADFKCEECLAADRTLNVHHKAYRKGAKPWEYGHEDLVCLCESCHRRRHDFDIALRIVVDGLSHDERMRLLGYAECIAVASSNQTLRIRDDMHAIGVGQALSYCPEQVRDCWRLLQTDEGILTPEAAAKISRVN